MDVERLGRAEPVDVPDLVDEPLAADDGPGLAHEQGEEVELLARELQGLAVERHRARRRVELDRADLLRAGRRGRRGRARAAQDGADAGDELAGAERLDDVVVGAELEAQHAVGLVAAGGEHDHRHALVGAQLAQQVEARAVGEHDVEEHEVGALAAGDLEARRQRAGRLRAEALAGEGFRQRNGDRVFVLDEQHHPRLDVHALIVGGLARCSRRFSRPRGGRGRRRRGRRCRRRRHGRRCRRSRRRPLLSRPPWPLVSPAAAVVAGRRGGRRRRAAAAAAAMAVAGAVLATGRLRRRACVVVVVVRRSARRWRARPRRTGRRRPRWSGRGRPDGAVLVGRAPPARASELPEMASVAAAPPTRSAAAAAARNRKRIG